ncbi:MAG: hypothetical protein KME27_20195 [Lyngbya sp. HA4199-MV5]|nr:hypothetical protein [Lyngbya sp. HA4199-MV5]
MAAGLRAVSLLKGLQLRLLMGYTVTSPEEFWSDRGFSSGLFAAFFFVTIPNDFALMIPRARHQFSSETFGISIVAPVPIHRLGAGTFAASHV